MPRPDIFKGHHDVGAGAVGVDAELGAEGRIERGLNLLSLLGGEREVGEGEVDPRGARDLAELDSPRSSSSLAAGPPTRNADSSTFSTTRAS